MKTYYAEVTVTYSFEFDEEDMEEYGTRRYGDPDEFARANFDEFGGQGFDFESVKVKEV